MADIAETVNQRPASAAGQIGGKAGTSRWRRIAQDRWMYLFMFPGLCYFLVFVYLPMAGNIIAWKICTIQASSGDAQPSHSRP